MNNVTDHRTISSMFLRQAQEECDAGDLLQASEKAWGAVAHYVRAIADERGWSSGSQKKLLNNAQRILEHSPHHLRLLASVERLHVNFYESFCTETVVRLGLGDAKELIAILKAQDLEEKETEWEEARRQDARHEAITIQETLEDGLLTIDSPHHAPEEY